MKPIYLLIAGAMAFSSCNASENATGNESHTLAQTSQNGTGNSLKTIGSQEAKTILAQDKQIVVLDVRTPEEYSGGHLENAILLNKNASDFESRIEALDRDKTYMVYCAAGGRSAAAARTMQKLGFKRIYDATEGFKPLKEAGIPVAL